MEKKYLKLDNFQLFLKIQENSEWKPSENLCSRDFKPCNAGLSAMYVLLILHTLHTSMHHMVMNAFQGPINLKSLHPGQ
jgi:hypothetical protein